VALLGGEPRKLIDDVTHADWSPDGRQIVFVRVKTKGAGQTWVLAVASADGGEAHEIADFEGTPAQHPRWSPDERLIAANIIEVGTFAAGRVLLLGAEGKDARRFTTLEGGQVLSSLSWSGAEELLYAQRELG